MQGIENFQNDYLKPTQVLYKIKHRYLDLPQAKIKKKQRLLQEVLIGKTYAWGYFDGAPKGNPSICVEHKGTFSF